MKDRVFLDTNVLVYLYTAKEVAKENQVLSILLRYTPVVSTQTLQELANVMTKKYGFETDQVQEVLEVCMEKCELHTNTYQTIQKALSVRKAYKFSFYDSLIVAAAADSGCQTLFSEDLQHGQQLASGLKVVNPFLRSSYLEL